MRPTRCCLTGTRDAQGTLEAQRSPSALPTALLCHSTGSRPGPYECAGKRGHGRLGVLLALRACPPLVMGTLQVVGRQVLGRHVRDAARNRYACLGRYRRRARGAFRRAAETPHRRTSRLNHGRIDTAAEVSEGSGLRPLLISFVVVFRSSSTGTCGAKPGAREPPVSRAPV